MKRKRRRFTEQFKAEVALEAIRGVKTTSELAAQYRIHPNQIGQWKKQLIAGAAEVFSGEGSRAGKTEQELTAPLYEEIGRLKMDLRWLEKKL